MKYIDNSDSSASEIIAVCALRNSRRVPCHVNKTKIQDQASSSYFKTGEDYEL